MIFGMSIAEKIWHEYLTELSTSPARCSQFTLGNPKKSYFPPENVTTLTCEMQNLFVRLKVCCVPSNVGGCEKSRLWVGIGGSEKNRLRCVATGMPGKQRHSECSKWPPFAWKHVSSRFRIVHHAVLKFSPCRNKPQPQIVRIADWYSIHALLLWRAQTQY